MALTDKEYEKFYKETGSGSDKIAAANKDYAKTAFEYSATHGFSDIIDDYRLGPIIYMMQQMQDELDYLRTEISNNKDKTGISTSQAGAITANTAKTGITNSQSTMITDNMNEAKRLGGLIDTNTRSTTANSSTITSLAANKLEVTPNINSGDQQRLTCGVTEKRGTFMLIFSYSDVYKATNKIILKTASILLS